MKQFNSADEYHEWVETIAQNNIDRDGSHPGYVANSCVTDIHRVDKKEFTLLYNGEPYISERVSPTAVLEYALEDVHSFEITTYRETAVDLLAVDISQAQQRIWEKSDK